jgi:hypothetical protein
VNNEGAAPINIRQGPATLFDAGQIAVFDGVAFDADQPLQEMSAQAPSGKLKQKCKRRAPRHTGGEARLDRPALT